MAFALTGFEAYGREIDEPVTKRFKQTAIITYTAANTDVAVDISNFSGTFWTAVGTGALATAAKQTLKTIQAVATQLTGTFSEDLYPGNRLPGATASGAGVFHMAVSSHLPSITYFSTDAPTVSVLILEWEMPSGIGCFKYPTP